MSIVVKNVTKLYGQQKALDNISFEIKTGEIVAFLGPNGAGKSTMMKIITGFIPATSGQVFVNGEKIDADNFEIKQHIGYLPENNPLYLDMYVREYLSFVASFYKKRPCKSVDEIIDLTGLKKESHKKIGSLSKGYKQRVGLAQALIHNPDVLILDEATTGLDPNQIVEIRDLILEAGKDKTVMLSTHIMQEVQAICDRILIIDKGVLVADEKKSEIYSKVQRKRQIVNVEFDAVPDEDALAMAVNADSITRTGEKTWRIESLEEEDVRSSIFTFAVANKLTVLSMQKEEANLEEVFRELTK
ncbi:MAG: gliding motility-associated ABC transporter ATP-binding subunit GldA [Bacteroidales bacterium]|nr:gliding motility-associated ABC transporter ATP-binding subunit GldA [Bacteroidales bacterium]